jgi:hypothetical protein
MNHKFKEIYCGQDFKILKCKVCSSVFYNFDFNIDNKKYVEYSKFIHDVFKSDSEGCDVKLTRDVVES